MIVVDTNIVCYLLLSSTNTSKAEALFQKDPHWVAPLLWRSEFRNVLALYMRKKILSFEEALLVQEHAEELFKGEEYELPSSQILGLVNSSECSAYDCEFVGLAKALNTRLVTEDKKILQQFPDLAIRL